MLPALRRRNSRFGGLGRCHMGRGRIQHHHAETTGFAHSVPRLVPHQKCGGARYAGRDWCLLAIGARKGVDRHMPANSNVEDGTMSGLKRPTVN